MTAKETVQTETVHCALCGLTHHVQSRLATKEAGWQHIHIDHTRKWSAWYWVCPAHFPAKDACEELHEKARDEVVRKLCSQPKEDQDR